MDLPTALQLASYPHRLPPAVRYVLRPPGFNHRLSRPLSSPTTTMLAVQKPVALFSSPSAHYRPSHSRHPSAPVLIRPTQTPGLLSLSKPVQPSPQRQQQAQQYGRAPRSSPKGKQNRSPQPAPAQALPVEDPKKPKASKLQPASPSDKSSKPSAVQTPEKPPRGRQSAKQAFKAKADRSSPSDARSQARRPSHQPSPPPPARTPEKGDSPAHVSVNPFRAQSFNHRDSDSNLFDPFVAHSTSDNESSESLPIATSNAGAKPLSLRAPQLAAHPTGKLAHRRQASQAQGSATPTHSVPVPRARHGRNQSKSAATAASATPQRRAPHASTTELPLAEWDDFPICDDLTVVSSPTTPVRESASFPKYSSATWQQSLLHEAPRTAPLSSTFDFPFAPTATFATPSPASRRRNHRRVPSEGVFAMSTDDDSSSDDSDELKNVMSKLALANRSVAPGLPRTPSPPVMDGMPPGFYAGSVFQNSPSPEELPVPAFRV
ncbi:hypothetical protein PHLGIDRAFT_128059 [Phlebiopsis gigantea 11061_1 CR5-6]|uniref:Uncharacterized protein n=1 Tax=Phlebiopsis gigantea (strain 11061_1 CR5-6) TaxID=745531 RepID=A0A0C3PKI0_PHLG1|nr:hypothetical protein PHLGIDRAFT_128059 [Phlebiopsis gigantea 11061_1 CR5-6]